MPKHFCAFMLFDYPSDMDRESEANTWTKRKCKYIVLITSARDWCLLWRIITRYFKIIWLSQLAEILKARISCFCRNLFLSWARSLVKILKKLFLALLNNY